MSFRRLLGSDILIQAASKRSLQRKSPLKTWSCSCVVQTRNFTVGTRALSSASSLQIPEPPPLGPPQVIDAVSSPSIIDATSGVLENAAIALNAAGEPSLASYGLGSYYWPSGWAQHAFEFLHANIGMPWWLAILTGTVAVRLALFPLVIKSQVHAVKFQNNMPQFQALQTKFNEAKMYGNQLEAARLMHEINDFMKKKDINPLKSMKLPLVQAPIFMSMFFALRGMASAPVESLRQGGLFWFTDLTIPDPSYALPILTCATLAAVMKVGVDTGSSAMASSPAMRILVKAIPVILFPFIMNFPTDLVWYWFCANSVSLLQVSVLKIPALRKKFGIPQKVNFKPEDTPPKKNFIEGFKESWSNMKAARALEERRQVDEIKFRKAGTGPVPKTYKYDPTKAPPTAQEILAKGSRKI